MQLLASAGKSAPEPEKPAKPEPVQTPPKQQQGKQKNPNPNPNAQGKKKNTPQAHPEQQQREENLANITAELMSDLSILDELTGKPLSDDILVCAIPMCAPYAAVKDFKFKVKLTPGSTKTGQATNMALSVFKRSSEITPAEKDLLTSVNDGEVNLQMMGNVKVSTPGLAQLSKAKKNQKNSKKK
jgi:hypothetical protein